VVARGVYTLSKYLSRRVAKGLFNPKSRTYRGAVGRGIGLSTLYEIFDDDGSGPIDDALQTPETVLSRQSQQGNYRFRKSRRSRRGKYYNKSCCCH